ncbi:WecB/TagA/CpsF family glycosyltransferase [Ornithinibacillus contaminans]|uniref:WecB/TagA/CpsF family glycosyltransferase n=1 Tax=Ornithinibacillus contaminans TaxID=694055 RepID=UPI00069FAA0A|nr:WecB/TagA/CpsF family glycosyltransferase [Ornithinibacillus contaminans]
MSISTQYKKPDFKSSDLVDKVNIMDINFINLSKQDLLEEHLYPQLLSEEKCFIVTANPEIVMRAREDINYKGNVELADYVVPDGAGVVLASKILKRPIEERIAGFDLMLDLLEFANVQKLSCYLFGAKDYVNERAVLEIKRRYPNLNIVGSEHGYSPHADKIVAEQIKLLQPDIILVALGSPAQENWITDNLHQFAKGVFMGVGGSFDVLAGEVKRAPAIWIKLNMEWLYRLLKQPFRWKRILKAIEFMLRIVLRKF